MRIIGLDIHRVAAEAVALSDGTFKRLGRIPMRREALIAFARRELTHDDHVVIEATGNAAAVADLLAPHVERVIVANPKQVRMIAHAKIKPMRSMPRCWRSSMRPDFCLRSGYQIRRHWPYADRWRGAPSWCASGCG